jgi:hypothetical protein
MENRLTGIPHNFAANKWPNSWMAISNPITIATATYDMVLPPESVQDVSK